MFKNRIVLFAVLAPVLLFSCTLIFAQTTDRTAIKSTPLIQQTKPQTDVQKAQIEQLITSLPKDRQKTFKAVSSIIAKQLVENMQSDKSDRRKEDDARQILTAGMDKTAIITNPADEKVLMQNTNFAVSYGLQKNVNQQTAKVATNNEIKQILREEILTLKDMLADWPDDGIVQKVTYNSCVKLSDDRYEIDEITEVMSKDHVEALIQKMEDQLASLTEMSQTDMLELQDAMNKQAQLMQMMSNIMKNMHDTAKAIIQNLK